MIYCCRLSGLLSADDLAETQSAPPKMPMLVIVVTSSKTVCVRRCAFLAWLQKALAVGSPEFDTKPHISLNFLRAFQ